MKVLFYSLLFGFFTTLVAPVLAQLSLSVEALPGGAENQRLITVSGFEELTPISDAHSAYYQLLIEFGDGHYEFFEVGRYTEMPDEYSVEHTYFNPFEEDINLAVVAKAVPIYSVNEEPDAIQQTITVSTMDVPTSGPENVTTGFIDIELEHGDDALAESKLTVIIDLRQGGKLPDGYVLLSYDAAKVQIVDEGGSPQWRSAPFMDITLSETSIPIGGEGRYSEAIRWQYEELSDFGYTITVDFEVQALPLNQTISFLVDLLPTPSSPAIESEGKSATVHSSLDPNTYQVSPILLGSGAAPQTLTYRLDFQNIGTAPENDVTLNITPDPGWDLSTLEVKEIVSGTLDGTVHPASAVGTNPHLQLLESMPTKVVWKLDQASLAGMSQTDADPERSLGHLIFEVETKPGLLQPCRSIASNAMVIFGSNAPVYTNQALTYCEEDCADEPGLSLGIIILAILFLVLIILEIIALVRLSSAPPTS